MVGIVDMFLEFVPELVEVIVSLSTELAWEPETLGYVFVAMTKVVRHLRRAIRPMLKDFLTKTIRPLILHPDPFVRRLSCQSLAVVLEQVKIQTRRMGIRCLLGWICVNHGKQEFMYGYAGLVGQMLMGVMGTFRSKSPEVLQILVESDLIQTAHFRQHQTASHEETVPKWLTEEFLQHTTLEYIKSVIGRYVVKRMDQSATIELWKMLLHLMQIKINDARDSITEDEDVDATSLLIGITRLTSIASFMLARKKGALLKNLNPIGYFLKLVLSETVQGELDVTGVPSWVRGMFAKETVMLVLHGLNLESRFRRDPLWSDSQAQLKTLTENVNRLTLSDLFDVSKEANKDLASLKSLVYPLMRRLAEIVMKGAASVEHQEMAWVQLDIFLESISAVDVASEGMGLFGEVSFPLWLCETIKAWPLDECTRRFSSRNARAAFTVGTYYLKGFAKIYIHEPAAIVESTRQMLSSLTALDPRDPSTLLTDADAASLRCHIILQLAENEAKISREEESGNPVPRLMNHLTEALCRLKDFPSEGANLRCVSELSKLIQETTRPMLDAVGTDSETRIEEDSFDFSGIISKEDLEYWMAELGPSLCDPDSAVRCSALEFLSIANRSVTKSSLSSNR